MKKTLSFAIIHFTVAFSLAFLLTGNLLIGGLIALIEPMVNTVAFYFHEKVWQTKNLVQTQHSSPSKKTISFAILHFSVAFTVVYLLTGDVLLGGTMAMIEPTINTFAYYLHERVWQKKQHQNTPQQLMSMMVCLHH
ncbi:DUF2061 domain-containing protein [Photobacterium phosphoreum]|jgi:uncharacterized membrane protein|uniref:DUF2061 domain-containing protein n=1 Tax=Photobacterium phosphoreum TaxID=659 RepID=A0AAW5A5K9_PHOPO|nr:DUF2061 domain-containing protein [Photobacterium phosphoreum]KJF87801.1 membrane protein [Photobacterium phosphoreum]MCD9464474.1 DUF2061 domain-containing protein [Photobacterium phosphoreum]MCD9471906.1 DUF2061 domain-containing protein [Photobacterium phosphoreum]MCD9475497.1 DUF2061 domain-containing protein [Photobacterium phosphoreum]MCD9480038.1 DUF2061 domain-containing protein [Photobacterium phosphoreum]